MSDMTNIVRKEIKELLTPGSVISVLVMVLLFAVLGGIIGGEVDNASSLPEFGIVGAENGDLSETQYNGSTIGWSAYDYLVSSYEASGYDVAEYVHNIDGVISADGTIDYAALERQMYEIGITAVILIPPDFASNITAGQPATIQQYYIYEASGMFGSISSTVVSSIINALNSSLSSTLISIGTDGSDVSFLKSPISSEDVVTVVDGAPHTGVTPQAIANQVSSQTMMIPIIIMIIIMMVGSIVISSMGSEKENKTLETLLTLPIKRTSIVTGKIVAAAIVGLVYGLAYMVGMSFYMGALMDPTIMGGGVDLNDLGLGLDITDYALVMISMFLAILCALGICMILGAFAKNYKSAQTMTAPMSILAIIPMFIVMFTGWYGAGIVLQVITFAIPFSHPMMAMQALMYDDVTLVLGGIVYMAIFALATILVTVKLYNSDILITGLGQNKYVQTLTGRK